MSGIRCTVTLLALAGLCSCTARSPRSTALDLALLHDIPANVRVDLTGDDVTVVLTTQPGHQPPLVSINVSGTNDGEESTYVASIGGVDEFPTASPNARVEIDPETGLTMLMQGMVFLDGVRPYGGTDGGTGIEEGSQFIIVKGWQRSDGEIVDRFIYFGKTNAAHTLTVKNAANVQLSVTAVGDRIDIKADGSLESGTALTLDAGGEFDPAAAGNRLLDRVINDLLTRPDVTIDTDALATWWPLPITEDPGELPP